MILKIGHTPDADDAFMYYALLNNKIDTCGLEFEDCLEPIAKLNSVANMGVYDVSAFSAGCLAEVSHKYDVLTSGVCMAENNGPVLIKNKHFSGNIVAVPGFNTTAYVALKIYDPSADCVEIPFTEILNSVINSTVNAGVLINEDILRIPQDKMEIIDLGKWWKENAGYPLPLGVDGIRSDLPENIKNRFCSVFRRSIEYALDNTEEALRYAVRFGRGIDAESAEIFVKRFVNSYTLNLGEKGKKAIDYFLGRIYKEKLIKHPIKIKFIEGI